ncbi:hypothetical protein [Bacteroides sp.]|uniref:hypothetical protein n=1 Tax=Bacteroides sp. TaxID=29523 RepID=UPI00260D625D|nr:hypothetical protein [Bacteroides sp.]MDD3039778.1 hypothetical protein [Bacteroides sp.]
MKIVNADHYTLDELMTFTFKAVSNIAKEMSEPRKIEVLKEIEDRNVLVSLQMHDNIYSRCIPGQPNTEYAKMKKLGYMYSCTAGYDNKSIAI